MGIYALARKKKKELRTSQKDLNVCSTILFGEVYRKASMACALVSFTYKYSVI
jgi:hypothetical protein